MTGCLPTKCIMKRRVWNIVQVQLQHTWTQHQNRWDRSVTIFTFFFDFPHERSKSQLTGEPLQNHWKWNTLHRYGVIRLIKVIIYRLNLVSWNILPSFVDLWKLFCVISLQLQWQLTLGWVFWRWWYPVASTDADDYIPAGPVDGRHIPPLSAYYVIVHKQTHDVSGGIEIPCHSARQYCCSSSSQQDAPNLCKKMLPPVFPKTVNTSPVFFPGQ